MATVNYGSFVVAVKQQLNDNKCGQKSKLKINYFSTNSRFHTMNYGCKPNYITDECAGLEHTLLIGHFMVRNVYIVPVVVDNF